MARQSPSAGLKTIIGYILPEQEVVQSNQDDVSVSEDEDDQEIQPEFLDMKEMDSVSSGANLFKSSVPASKEGKTTLYFTKLVSFGIMKTKLADVNLFGIRADALNK